MQNHSHAERKQLFQNNYFKKHNLQKTRTSVHVFEMLIEPLSFCVFDYYKKEKKIAIHCSYRKNLRSYLTYIFKRWKNESSNKVYVKTKLI